MSYFQKAAGGLKQQYSFAVSLTYQQRTPASLIRTSHLQQKQALRSQRAAPQRVCAQADAHSKSAQQPAAQHCCVASTASQRSASQLKLQGWQQSASRGFLSLSFLMCTAAAASICIPEAALAWPTFSTPLPLQILGFLLNHPVITLALAAFMVWAIPRLARAAVRFILIPAGVLGISYLVITNPQTSFAVVGTSLSYVSSHPIVTSAVILVGLSFVLSPYILVAGASVLLIGGYKILPAQLRFLVPGPVIEVDKQLTAVRQKVFRSGQELQREAPRVKADPEDFFGRLKKIATAN